MFRRPRVYRVSTPGAHAGTVKVIRCDCGFEASEDDEEHLVSRAREHARDVHHQDLPAQFVLAVAGAGAGARTPAGPPAGRRHGQVTP